MHNSASLSLQTPILLFCISLTARAIFSFLETSITALRLFKVKELAQTTTGRYKNLLYALEKNQSRVLITILIANSLADVTTAAIATHITEHFFKTLQLPQGLGFTLGIGIASLAIIVFGEIIPKNVARGSSDRLLGSMLWLTNIIFYLFHPLVTILMQFSNAFIRLFGGTDDQEHNEWITSEREIQFLIEYINRKGLMESEKTAMLKNIFELGTTPVKEIMLPAPDIISIDVTTPIEQTLALFKKHKFTRLPVYDNQPDNIIGMVHQKDIFALLPENQNYPLKDIVRPILFIPESIKISQLLREFRQQHMHIAIVLNEHGITTGLITLEDVLEEIVGEIIDEHEPMPQKITRRKNGSWLVDASIPLEELEDFLNISFTTEDSVTLAGFLTEQLQHLPKPGEHLTYQGYIFNIKKASFKRILQVIIVKKEKDRNRHSTKNIDDTPTQ